MFQFRSPIYIPKPAPTDDGLSAVERYAKSIRETAVPDILKTIKSSKRLGMLLVLLVIVISFQHQRDFFAARHAGEIGSIGLPVIFDLSIIFLVKVISTTGMNKLAIWFCAGALVIPVGASATINFVASPDTLVGLAYVIAIGLVAVIEVIKALIKPDPAALAEAEHSADAIAAEATPADPTEAKRQAKRFNDAVRRAVIRELAKLEAAAAVPVSPAHVVGPMAPSIHIPTPDEMAALAR